MSRKFIKRAKLFILSLLALIILSMVPVTAHSSSEGIAANSTKNNLSKQNTKNALPDYTKLKAQLDSYIKTRPGEVSVYVKDLETGKTLNIESDKVYVAASTIKLPLILYVYELAAQGQIDLNKKLTYTPEYYAQDKAFRGNRCWTIYIKELSVSVNTVMAWKMLLDIRQDKLTAYEKSWGAKATGR